MAMIGRKEPATQPAAEPRPKTRPAPATAAPDNSRMGRFRAYVDSVIAELRKVNWPTREETRNLSIVVIGITAVIGGALGLLDFVLSLIYGALNNIQ
jgi:preprotein translocase subunit SecE